MRLFAFLASVGALAVWSPTVVAETAQNTSPSIANGLPATRPLVDSAIEFPDPQRHAFPKTGLFVDPRNVALVAPGMTKREVYALLPPPHFGEGLLWVRRWNYVLNFYTGTESTYMKCQYQIRYDRHGRVTGTWFREQTCSDLFNRLVGTSNGGSV